ncbi:MAG: ATP synthase F1 subunit delta [Myxococcota bacterium]
MSSTIGRRYAKALLALAEEQKQTAKVRRDLDSLVATWADSKELREIFENPAVTTEARAKVLQAVSQRLGLSPILVNTLKLLSDRRRLRHVPEVAEAFAELAEEAAGGVLAEVTTATKMPEAYFVKLTKALEAAVGKKITLVKREDPELIAGVVTRVGDRVFDGSLRTRLQELKDQMLAN